MTDPQNTTDPDPLQEAPHQGVAQEHADTAAPQVEAPVPPPSDQGTQDAGAGTAAPSTEGPGAPTEPAATATAAATARQSKNNVRQGPKPISVRGVLKKCHDNIQIVQEDFIVNTLRQEKKRAIVVVGETDRDLNYLRSQVPSLKF